MARYATINKGTPYETQLTLPEPNQWFRTDDIAHAFRVENGELVAYNLTPGRDPRLKDAPPEARGNLPYFNESDVRTVVEGGGGRTGTSLANEAYPEFFKKPEPEKGQMKEFTTPSGAKFTADPIDPESTQKGGMTPEQELQSIKQGGAGGTYYGRTPAGIVDLRTNQIVQGTEAQGGQSAPFGQTRQPIGQPQTPAPFDTSHMKEILKSAGYTDDVLAAFSPNQLAVAAAAIEVNRAQSSLSNPISLPDALNLAKTDPIISAKYADSLGMGTSDFGFTIDQLQAGLNTTAQSQATQFQNEQRNLAEQEAAAGRAYSGFRQQAETRLKQEQSGIVESTRRQTQKALRDAQEAFTSKFGTAATSPTALSYQNPFSQVRESITTPIIPGITGSDVLGKKQDINTQAQAIIQYGKNPNA